MNAKTAALGVVVTAVACVAFHFFYHRSAGVATAPSGSPAMASHSLTAAHVSLAPTSIAGRAHAGIPAQRQSPDAVSQGVLCLAAADGRFVPYAERRRALGSLPQQLGDGEIALVTNFLVASGVQW